MEWPSQSLDMNPIEHIWGILKKGISMINPSSKHTLKQYLLELEKITPLQCQRLVDNMPTRIGCLIKAKGLYTKY